MSAQDEFDGSVAALGPLDHGNSAAMGTVQGFRAD